MPEQDLAKRSRSNPQSASADVKSTRADAAQQHPQPMPAELTDSAATIARQAWEQERQALVEELEQARAALREYSTPASQDQEQFERIRQLEQALDQSQAQVSELRSKLCEQQMLETQLVATEEVANLQQVAIAQLKHQLSCQQQALEAQITQAQAKDQTVQELLATIETLAFTQQSEIERLRTQLSLDRTAIQTDQKRLEKQLIHRQTDLESQQQRVQELESQILRARTLARGLEVQLAEQERHIEGLYNRLSDRSNFLNQMEAQLQQAHDALEAQQDLHASLLQTQALSREQNTTIAALYRQIETLETQLAQQVANVARLQQACQELTHQSDRYQSRTIELEGHLGALQEQILMQAQQASEYEAAIQYWKDQCGTSLRHAQQLKEVLERVPKDRPDEILAHSMIIQCPESGTPVASPQPGKHLQVDLPDFLRKTSTGKGAKSQNSESRVNSELRIQQPES